MALKAISPLALTPFFEKRLSLTPAQMAGLDTDPIELLPAKAGTIYAVISCVAFHSGTVAAGVSTWALLYLPTTNGGAISQCSYNGITTPHLMTFFPGAGVDFPPGYQEGVGLALFLAASASNLNTGAVAELVLLYREVSAG